MLNGTKLVETWGNGMEVHAVQGPNQAVIADGTILVRGRTTYQVGTVSGFRVRGASGCGTFSAVPAGERLSKDGHKAVWINQRPSTICAGTHPDHKVKALAIEPGQLVWLEGREYLVTAEPNQNLGLQEL